jgi:hypothetical protein
LYTDPYLPFAYDWKKACNPGFPYWFVVVLSVAYGWLPGLSGLFQGTSPFTAGGATVYRLLSYAGMVSVSHEVVQVVPP